MIYSIPVGGAGLDPSRVEIDVALDSLHIGSRLGLCPPKALMDLGDKYQFNEWQKWIWYRWIQGWEWAFNKIYKLEKSLGYRVYRHLTLVGDLGDVDLKQRSSQIWSKNYATLIEAAITLLEPVIQEFDGVHFILGTEAHGGPSNDIEQAIAGNFDNAIPDETTGLPFHWSADFELGGVLFNVTHHGKIGRLPWSVKNALNTLRAQVELLRYRAGERVPDVIIRGHNHFFAQTVPSEPPYVVSLPGWQLKTAFGYRIDPTDVMPEVGLLLTVCQGGKFTPFPKVYQKKRSKPWKTSNRITWKELRAQQRANSINYSKD